VGLAAWALLAVVCAGPLRAAPEGLAASWAFEGDLRDGTGHGHGLQARAPQFVAGHSGQGLRTGAAPALAPDRAELRLAPGLRLDCWVQLASVPADGLYFLAKEDEYMLRVDPAGEGGHFAFFVFLDGWEPRVRSQAVAAVGVWYHLVAGWDGKEVSLEVDGAAAREPRAGVAFPGGEPLRLDLKGGVIDELQISNPNARRGALVV